MTASTAVAVAMVNPAATTTTVTATPDPSTVGEAVTVCSITSIDAPATGTPTGTVLFTIPGGINQGAVMNGDGQACITTTMLTTGTVTATYSGSDTATASTGTTTVTVNQASTTTTVTAVPDPSIDGHAVTICSTTTVDGTAIPSGTVTFTLPGGGSQVVTINTSGQACMTTTTLTSGTVTAAYSGDTAVTASTGTTTVTVNPDLPSVPRNVTASQGVSSIVVNWEPPAKGAPVTGYVVTASPGPATCTTTGATTCVLGAVAGTTYTVTVVALSAAGNSSSSEPSDPVTPVAPTPPVSPPATNLTLTTTDGNIKVAEPGQDIVFVGTGFAPFSTVVVTIYSAPTVLGTFTTDANGNFQAPVTLSEQLSAGHHTVVAMGVAPNGSPRSMALAVTVASDTGAGLAVTGPAVAMMLMTGIALAATGTGLVVVGRPRRRRY